MADKTNGALIVSDDVLADLVGYAAKECYGVVGMTSPAPTSVQEGIAGLLPAQRLRRGIEIDRDENGKLEKRAVSTGRSLWGSYTQINGGLTGEEYIAFPYGNNIRAGAKTEISDVASFYNY